MTASNELSILFHNHYGVLILDNEVTVGHFVSTPPLLWARLIQRAGTFEVAEGYPVPLTAQQTQREMRLWDQVSLPLIIQTLKDLRDSVDYVVIGNNAGQGLPLAKGVPQALRAVKAAIIYGESLPEIKEYQGMGYRTFLRRSDLVSHLAGLAKSARRAVTLAFINTIQHDAASFHEP
ncbi:MAG: hypothetical protein ACREQA_08230 [Candidatus Binatia bacterium]